MSLTWAEYIELSLKRINTRNSKHIMLHLSKHSDREWTPKELKGKLGLDIDEDRIKELLENMVKADLIARGGSDIDFRGLKDGTLNLILRHRFEKEIESYQPDLKSDFRQELEKLEKDKKSLQGLVNHLTGKMAEYQLMTEFRSKKRFAASRYFANVADDATLNVVDVRLRTTFQRPDGKAMEIDVLAESDCGMVLAVEVKKDPGPGRSDGGRGFSGKDGSIRRAASGQAADPGVFLHGRVHGRGAEAVRRKRDRHGEPVRFP